MSEQIVACARSYIGTRFQHQGRLKKTHAHRGGIDCLGLLVGVAQECGLRSKTGELLADCDDVAYPHAPDTVRLRDMLERHLLVLPLPKVFAGGEVALCDMDGRAQHLGIISFDHAGEYGIIHAYAPARAVVEHPLDGYWREKIVAVFGVISLAE